MPAPASKAPLVAAAVLLVAAGVAGWYFLNRRPAAEQAAPQPAVAVATPAPAATPVIEHPVETAPAATLPTEAPEPLPTLAESDAPLVEALRGIAGNDTWSALLRPAFVIQRVVATVDALPGRKLAPDALPVAPVGGRFAVTQRDGQTVIASENAARYDHYVEALRALPPERAAALYLRYYPLFQQAYRELGHEDGYFNDRLVVVIDHLLAAPAALDPTALAQPKVMYTFADPALEQRSAGEKLMLRIGSSNAGFVRAWLQAFRAAVTAAPPPAGTAPTPEAAQPQDDSLEQEAPKRRAGDRLAALPAVAASSQFA